MSTDHPPAAGGGPVPPPSRPSYPIGTPGQPWGAGERAQWLARQRRLRSYRQDVLQPLAALADRVDLLPYGDLQYGDDHYPLLAARSPHWQPERPTALVTGGVHGYETSGVHGALQFLQQRAGDYARRVNLLVVPCVSPWGYERIHRWNAEAVDPNRAFRTPSPAREAALLMQLVASLGVGRWLLHIDLHETTDSDESEFRPALAARDGKAFVPATIPEGFYLVGDSEKPQLAFQQAIIAAVEQVTAIAAAEADGTLLGDPCLAKGVIVYPCRRLGLCAAMTNATFTTTTEVYPDSPRTSPAECNIAQVVAACAALDYALGTQAPG